MRKFCGNIVLHSRPNPRQQRGVGLPGRPLEAQGKVEEAAQAQQQFKVAWTHADVTLTTSRF